MQAYRTRRAQGAAARWEDLPAPLRDNLRPAEVACHGCRSDAVFAGCCDCSVRKCAKDKGVAACVACGEFPCAKVASLRGLVARVKARRPHTAAIFGDAGIARERGCRAWAEMQRARWSCPGCGAPFTWYQQRCHGCGLELMSIRGY
jgi:hypothetical protein